MILSFPCNFFVCFKFLSDLGRVIGKIKQNELDCRDTAPLSLKLLAGFLVVTVFKDELKVRKSLKAFFLQPKL